MGYSLLAAIVEIVSGLGYEDFLAEQLFAPAGMRDTGYSRPKWAATRLARAIGADGKDRGTFGEVAMPKGMPGWYLLGNGGIPQSGYEEARDASGAVTAVRLRFLPVNQPALLVTVTLEPPASQDRPTRVAAIELEMGN